MKLTLTYRGHEVHEDAEGYQVRLDGEVAVLFAGTAFQDALDAVDQLLDGAVDPHPEVLP